MKNLIPLFIFSLVFAPFFGVETPSGLALFGLGYFVLSVFISSWASGKSVFFETVIPIQDSQGLFTKKLIAVFKEQINPTGFLKSFFKPVESMTKEVSIAVRRGSETVAVDVFRFSDGNRNTFDKSSEKIFIPPFYDEYLTANQHRLYDQVILALSNNQTTFFVEMTAEILDDLIELRNKIERATELQCAQILQTGIVELKANTNINFQRRAASMVDPGAGNYWANGTTDPYKQLEVGCNFIRTKGKTSSTVFNCILGSEALTDLFNNTIFLKRNDLKNVQFDAVRPQQRNAEGAAAHGEITCGSYTVRLWTYPQFYDDANGVSQPYIDPKLAILLPEDPQFVLAYAAVPQLIKDGAIPQKGAYLIQEFIDEKATSHEIHIKSAPLAVPVTIDRIYTLKAKA